MKKQKQGRPHTKARTKTPTKTIEREYQETFTPRTLPYQGLYTDEDSLEQPSELEYVPTTATPNVET
jgi:hypothetical protein